MNLKLSEIFIYPIKSLGGISLNRGFVELRGLQYDRRMMLVDQDGKFLTQRTYPQMALLKTSINDDTLVIRDSRNNDSISISLLQSSLMDTANEKIKVVIWDDICSALKISKESDQFFSDTLGIKCSLVYMPDDENRLVDPKKKYIKDEHAVSFADGYPFLIIGQASLDDLNERLIEHLPMNRFRPNFVFTGGNPFEEDNWDDFLIGNVKFKAVKPCDRCVITTTDQNTAERNEEPLRTLATFRKKGNKVLFGMNLVCKSTGVVSVGDFVRQIT
ncbi:MAG TPA: MOSC domain-containing protein [Ignavibacteriaceae bacterium]|jgi:uncharacterized protein YcbX|nr:MOSC domain-containing protein [Ignavibacteriaceae bacterium]